MKSENRICRIFLTGGMAFICLSMVLSISAFGGDGDKAKDRDSFFKRHMSRFPHSGDWDDDWEDENDWSDNIAALDMRYNRVEGLYAGVKAERSRLIERYPEKTFVYGSAGYAFSAKEFEYRAGIEKGFFESFRFALGAEVHRSMDTQDRWFLSEFENSMAAWLIKEDFHDFYFSEGASAYVSQGFGRHLILEARYNVDEWSPVKKNTNWSLFGGKKRFRDNPEMDEGEIRSMSGGLVLDSRDSRKRPFQGWFVTLEGEHAGDEMKSDFTYDRFIFDIRRYQPLGFEDGLSLRIRAGSSKGLLPWQRSFQLGGIGTLRAYPYKTLPAGPFSAGANRMLLGQVEYRLGQSSLPEGLAGFLDFFHLILFCDSGWIGQAAAEKEFYEGFSGIEASDLFTDVGIALTNADEDFRIELARRTDTGKKPFVIALRLAKTF
ncbi:BamA/TamA family outer membrane protein [bacterium]|nr:BamA/TamA family outer membrane protein [bacterium]